jgi:hypothetical protein
LNAYRSYRDAFDDMSYWAPTEAKDVEVDFLLRRGRSYVAIEAKAGSRFRADWLAGLRAIAPLKGLRRRLLVYGGRDPLRVGEGIEVLTVEGLCSMLKRGTLF